eukprot:218481-Pyramimonas_sp.AAC.1
MPPHVTRLATPQRGNITPSTDANVTVRNVPLPVKGRGVAFPFGYINPTYPTVQPIMRKYYPGNLANIPGTGNSPVLIR